MSSVNSCVQTCESPKPRAADVLAASCGYLMGSVRKTCDDRWLGRPFDLKGAYRQCAVRPSSSCYSHTFVRDPHSGARAAFRMLALPFGAVRSVHGFLRIVYSVWFILVKEFRGLTTCYFDNFAVLSTESESKTLASCVQLVFKILGWRFAATGSKAPDFAECFHALGITVNVAQLHTGLALFDNTETRITELVAALDAILASRKLRKAEAFKLRGRLQFSSSQFFGRVAKTALAGITFHAYNSASANISDEVAFALSLHRCFLTAGKPRDVRRMRSQS